VQPKPRRKRAIDSIQEAIDVLAPAPGTVPKAPET
jgi:hypothetical protein